MHLLMHQKFCVHSPGFFRWFSGCSISLIWKTASFK
jgi:hypothetical protein